jgi:hypothetical protein
MQWCARAWAPVCSPFTILCSSSVSPEQKTELILQGQQSTDQTWCSLSGDLEDSRVGTRSSTHHPRCSKRSCGIIAISEIDQALWWRKEEDGPSITASVLESLELAACESATTQPNFQAEDPELAGMSQLLAPPAPTRGEQQEESLAALSSPTECPSTTW